MKGGTLEKAYEPSKVEERIYEKWLAAGAFSPAGDGEPYCIVIPPPNVTGVLHLGHALDHTLQDVAVRFHRMLGERTLWVPGTDHAGLATQNVVEKKLRASGVDSRSLGREAFIKETWNLVDEHHGTITRQIRRMGSSVDWGRERFTLDEGLSRAVRDVFVSLYERGLLYKGNYLVHRCTRCGTALSDDEVEHEEEDGALYHIKYKVAGKNEYIEIATTRPETLFGDSAVAVHPEDERYASFKGAELELPLTDRRIPLIFDSYVDKDFGTGALKITPAHDHNDWEVGKRHGLPVLSIMTADGKLNDTVPPKYRALSMLEARKASVKDLEEAGLLVSVEKIRHSVGKCYRCGTVIEPYMSEQWFVKMQPLAEKALKAWERGEIVFYPRKWENTYAHWLRGIRDWCISRQLWWGHRIPAWYCASCGKTIVSRDDIEKCPDCGGVVTQDEDVLDTWFSSWLWPFSVHGWEGGEAPATPFFPTTALVTAYDIIFFWVSRMIMASLEFTGRVPFRDIYIHGLLRDKQGRKMSKTLGNGIDPMDIINEYGADALKFTLCFLCAQGDDIRSDKESFKLGSKFANKVWNAARFILLNLEGKDIVENPARNLADEWIYASLAGAAEKTKLALLGYKYNEAALTVYEYFWNDFCDWYVEAAKLSFRAEDSSEQNRAISILIDVLTESLKLLHPFLPFVTEEIYSYLPLRQGAPEMLITARYPEGESTAAGRKALERFAVLQELVTLIRTLRSECTIPPDARLRAAVSADGGAASIIEDNASLVKILAGLSDFSVNSNADTSGSILLVGSGFQANLFVADIVDTAFIKTKFLRDAEKDEKYAASIDAKLSNDNFLKNAPAAIVDEERKKCAAAKERSAKLRAWSENLR